MIFVTSFSNTDCLRGLGSYFIHLIASFHLIQFSSVKQHVLELRLYVCLCQKILQGLFDSYFHHYSSVSAQHKGAEEFDHFYSVSLTLPLLGEQKKEERAMVRWQHCDTVKDVTLTQRIISSEWLCCVIPLLIASLSAIDIAHILLIKYKMSSNHSQFCFSILLLRKPVMPSAKQVQTVNITEQDQSSVSGK